MKKTLSLVTFWFAVLSIVVPAQPLLAQAGWLPFHWAWRDYPFSDSFASCQSLDMITVTPQGKRHPSHVLYQHIVFDSLGRSVEETYFSNDELESGTTHQLHWRYYEDGCPHPYSELRERGNSPSDSNSYSDFGRFVCKSGKLYQSRGEWDGLNAITQYAYDDGQQLPQSAIVYQNSLTWNPKIAMDTLHFHYDSLGRRLGYTSRFQDFTITYPIRNSDITVELTQKDGSSLRMSYSLFRDKLPWEISVLKYRRVSGRGKWQSSIYFR
jgi:hypothetical protein